MSSVFLILGSNSGKSLEMLEKSRVLIIEHIGRILNSSPIYRSEPWGFESEDWFYNQAIRCETSLSAEEVLNKIFNIETELGRVRFDKLNARCGTNPEPVEGYESRTIDIDILYFDNEIIQTDNLEIPHKHLQERRFVLMPLNDIAPDFMHPILKKTTSQLLKICEDEGIVEYFLDFSKRPKYPYIAIEGVIGVGKTTLAGMLSETFNAKLVLESFAENPFLPKFYEDQEKYAFPVELSFMAERFHQLQEHLPAPDLFHDMVVSDYITEKSLIFAGNTLSEDVFSLYSKLFHIIFAQLPKPDLLVYLYASPEKLKQNIVKRGRDYEQNIELDYLSNLQDGYLEHFKSTDSRRVLIIDVNDLDFVSNPKDYYKILGLLQENYPPGVSIRNLQINDEI
ncbi:MAG: 2-amino-4-hydroxy-6-hydroxymethyldihydropteridine diphosphokinase [Bacteroidales bacterium]|nr:2-amino-4-hydroxy-6-hydroxymethyldihydropteridine diphosphokinase [Bacteroidales bacterium]